MWWSAVGVLVAFTLGMLTAPLATEAQTPPQGYRIGVLSGRTFTSAYPRREEAFRHGLRDLGYIEGQHIAVEFRYAAGQWDRLPALAAELVGLNVQVLVASGSPSVAAAQQATRTIPIVMTHVGDPVAGGFVASLARPGGNITGLSTQGADIIGKQLGLLREAVPHLSRLAVLWNPPQPAHRPFLKTLEAVAGSVGIQLHPVAVHRPEDLEDAFAAMRAARAEALMFTGSGLHYDHLRQIADLARTSGLPAMTWERAFAEGGLLMTYGPDEEAIFRRAAYYVARILQGVKPSDLPVEQPIKFELVINLKTAQALGLTLPPSLLFQADEVIK